MKPYPHHYAVSAAGAPQGNVTLTSEGLETLASAPPVEFDGPGDLWAPETLLVAAVADCFVLTFRSVARASKLAWTNLVCRAEGTLDRADHVTRFVAMRIHAHLTLPAGSDVEAGRRLLEKAESHCLISNSLKLEVALEPRVSVL